LTFAQPSRGGSTLPALRAFFTPVARRRSPPVKKDNKASSLKIDKTKGYLIAINTSGFAETFGKTNGVYAISENRQVRVRDHDIKDRERIRVKNLRDIVEFLKRVDARRLQHTKVLFRNVLYNWDEFFIHYQKPERFDALIKKLDVIHPRDRRLQSGYLLRGGFHPCIMEIRVQMPKRDSPKWPFIIRQSQSLFCSDPDEVMNGHLIQPVVLIPAKSDFMLQHVLSPGKTVLVMGMVQLSRTIFQSETHYKLSIRVEGMDAVVEETIENLAALWREKRSRKRSIGTAPKPI
jgi:hypothetical protein